MALHSRNPLKMLRFQRREIAGIYETPYIYGGPSGAPYKQAQKRRNRSCAGSGARAVSALHRNGNEVVICDLHSGRF